MITVLIADDQHLVRSGLRLILDAEDDMEVIGEAADGREAIELAALHEPTIILMDIRMPEVDGIAATTSITKRNLATRIIMVTTFDPDEYIYDALTAGASGFLLKDSPAEDLVEAIRVVAAGDAVLSPQVTRRLIEQVSQRAPVITPVKAIDSLTDREREVLLLLGKGLANVEIAETLFVSETTVKTHVSHILGKLSLSVTGYRPWSSRTKTASLYPEPIDRPSSVSMRPLSYRGPMTSLLQPRTVKWLPKPGEAQGTRPTPSRGKRCQSDPSESSGRPVSRARPTKPPHLPIGSHSNSR